MKVEETKRGFRIVGHTNYPGLRLIQESSAIGDNLDGLEKPGSSFLWVGEHHHLNREEVIELAELMIDWANDGRLPLEEEGL